VVGRAGPCGGGRRQAKSFPEVSENGGSFLRTAFSLEGSALLEKLTQFGEPVEDEIEA
jgi:hypothetical protein